LSEILALLLEDLELFQLGIPEKNNQPGTFI